MTTRLSDQEQESRKAAILALYNGGALVKDIAVSVGLSAQFVGALLKRYGVDRPTKPQKRPLGKPDPREKILLLWAKGLSAEHISERLQVRRRTVDYILSAEKVRAGKPRRISYADVGGGSGRSGFAANQARRT